MGQRIATTVAFLKIRGKIPVLRTV